MMKMKPHRFLLKTLSAVSSIYGYTTKKNNQSGPVFHSFIHATIHPFNEIHTFIHP